ncbi:O-antigen ligase family protein [Streptomyces fuscigenes]|uniref:O-antigen ligase family protein n=1 Tax=Streptomyces fuscigenes TaxID=1528880 RepID=UPI001F459FED|nr:O-antigen ligase family protein [Streptomyces fuscigenes]MCF3965197.1 O-antigen ligase family protein [Streptomyces fuscigenes]
MAATAPPAAAGQAAAQAARAASFAPAPRRGAGAVRRHAHLVPVLAVIALLAAPAPPGGSASEGTGTIADAASGVLVLFCALRVLRLRQRTLGRTAAVALGLPVAGVSIAAVVSQDPAFSLAGVPRYLQIFVLVPLSLVLLVRDRRDFGVVAGGLVALALVQGAVGVVQYATATGASYEGKDVRAVGTFGATDVMGMATAVAYGLIIAVGYALDERGDRRRRALALAGAALLAVPLVLSFSRGAWIATAAALALMLVASGLRRAVVVALVAGALGVVLIGGAGVGSQMVSQRLASITQVTDDPDQSVTDRYTMWAAAVAMWRQDPVTGVGLKGFPAHRDANASLALSSGSDTDGAGAGFQRQPLLSPHNMYLLILSEQGVLGVLALVGSWLALLVRAVRRLPHARRARRCTGIAVLVPGLLVWQLIDFAYADIGGPSTVLTAVMFGLAATWSVGTVAGRRAAEQVPAR